MGYRVRASAGRVNSWGTGSNFNATILARCRPMRYELTEVGEEVETTAMNGTAGDFLPGLKSWTVDVETYALATPVHGSVGLVELTSGTTAFVEHIDSWSLNWKSSQVHRMTDLRTATGGTLPEWHTFQPDYSVWTCQWTAYADSANALKLAHSYKTNLASSDTRPTVKFTYGNGVTPESLSGKVQVVGVRLGARRGELQPVTITGRGVGDLTPAGTASVFGTTALGVPLWSQGSTATGAIVLDSLTGSRTLTGEDSFLAEMTVSAGMDAPMMLNLRIQGSGSLTPA